MLILRLGWRNLWRNRRRSFLTVASIAAAFAILVVLVGLVDGIAQQLVVNGTRTLLGHVQLHAAAYLPGRVLHDTIGGAAGTDVATLMARIDEHSGGHSAPRVYGFALLSTGPRSAGAQLIGVDPAREARVTTLQNAIVEGSLATLPQGQIVIGQILADELTARLGSEIAVVTQAADGTMGNELYTVSGIVRTGMIAVDRSLALLHIDDLQALLALPAGRIHEVALHIELVETAASVAEGLTRVVTTPSDLRFDPWQTLAPQISEYLTLTRSSNWMLLLIVGTFAAFGVLNTMLMAVFERTHEIGVLAALGLRPRQILATIVVESVGLAIVGLAGGLLLGAAGIGYFATYGWDLGRWTDGVTMAGVLFDPVLRATWDWDATANSALVLAAVTIVAGLIPAVRAARMRPVEALAAPGE